MRHFNDAGCLNFNFDPDNAAQLLHVFPIYEPLWKYGGWDCGGNCRIADPRPSTDLVSYIV
ncbi:hypothetical protein FA95DRAFT_1563794 [Auriscalpium vulgare]|nr:hypothetical protein FA95DRAFT_1563794 [Auriscalpium vulgare]